MTRPEHWPSQHAILLLRAALLDGAAAERAWRRALMTIDLDTLDPGAARLLPLAQHNVGRMGLDDPWAMRVRGVRRFWWANSQVLLRHCADVLAELEAAAVPTVILKGVAVGTTHYADLGLRPMTDFDILVRAGDASRALSVLAAAGWAPERRVDDDYRRLLHGVSLHDRAGRTLDLHWAIHEDDVRAGADDRAWSTARAVDIGGVKTRMLAPASLLLHAISSGAKWAADPAVRWIPDATLIIRRGDVDWEDFIQETEARRFVVRARTSLAYLVAALDVAVPVEVMERLDRSPASIFERLEHQVRTRRHPWLGELPRYWFNWLRSPYGTWRAPGSFVTYLRAAWDLPSPWRVPRAAARRAATRLLTRSSTAARTTFQ